MSLELSSEAISYPGFWSSQSFWLLQFVLGQITMCPYPWIWHITAQPAFRHPHAHAQGAELRRGQRKTDQGGKIHSASQDRQTQEPWRRLQKTKARSSADSPKYHCCYNKKGTKFSLPRNMPEGLVQFEGVLYVECLNPILTQKG